MTPRRRSAWIWGLTVAGVAALFRLPAFLSPRHLGYDDGVYLSSVLLMREGLDPFRDFFSSQGPVFLPFLRLFDMAGIGDLRAARLGMVFSGALVASATYLLARREHPPLRAMAGGLLAASSGLLLMAAGPVQSDGLALALGVLAIVVASGDGGASPWPAVVAGVLLATGLATKHAHLIPITVVVFLLVAARSGAAGVVRLVGSGAVTGTLITLASGPGAVWDQYVLFHLSKPRDWGLVDNAVDLARVVVSGELPVVVLLIAGIALGFVERPSAPQAGDRSLPSRLLALWLGLTVAMDILVTPVELGFGRFAAFLVPPLIILALRTPIPTSLVLAFAVLALPYQWTSSEVAEVFTPSEAEAEIVTALRDVPGGGMVVTDEQGMAWMAERLVHPDMVDTSYGRIAAGSIGRDDVQRALDDPRTCIFLASSGRFEALGITGPPDGLDVVLIDEESVLAAKPECRAADD